MASLPKDSIPEHPPRYFFPLAFLYALVPMALVVPRRPGLRNQSVGRAGSGTHCVRCGGGAWAGLKTVLLRIVRGRVGIHWYLAVLLLAAAL